MSEEEEKVEACSIPPPIRKPAAMVIVKRGSQADFIKAYDALAKEVLCLNSETKEK